MFLRRVIFSIVFLFLCSATVHAVTYKNTGTATITLKDTEVTSLIDWQTLSGDAANSINLDPLLLSTGKISKVSPCVDTGTWITGINDTGEADPWGKYVHKLPNIGADQGAGTPKQGRLIMIGNHEQTVSGVKEVY